MDQKKIIQFLVNWIAASVIIIACEFIFRGNVVLGTESVSAPMAAVFAGFVLTFSLFAVPELVKKGGLSVKDEKLWGGIFLVSNAVLIWVIKRFALLFGLGISNILYVAVVAVFVTLGQYAVGRSLGMMEKK